MGCVCGKASSAVKDSEESPRQRELSRKTSELREARAISSKRNESFSLKEYSDMRNGFGGKKVNVSRKVRDDPIGVQRVNSEVLGNFPGMGAVPKALEGEQVAAGWPSWLVSVAGEAIRGWIPRKADTFEKLDKIGQGTYSTVYKGRDLVSNKLVALKRVRFDNMDPESVRFMAREINILRRLDHPNVIKLEGLVTSRTSSSLYLVFEYMEHDLTGIASLPGVKFTEPQMKCYMHQLLSGLDYCHSHGILHRDIKGSNLLIDDHGILKIADFGLATYFDNHQSVPLTTRVVTLWYRPPELLLGATKYEVGVDLWSAGCILGELYAGKAIMPGRTEVEQLHKIFKLCGSPSEDYWRKSKLPHSTVFKPVQPYRPRIAETYKDLPDAAVRLMQTLLAIDPSDRGTAASALMSEFFRAKPHACDPSSLPKYPPSKEIDAKLREDEARRQRALGAKGQRGENDLQKSKELRAAPAPDANAELARSMQRRQVHPNPTSRSELFNSHREESASSFPVEPLCATQDSKDMSRQNPSERGVYHSGPLAPGGGWPATIRKNNDSSLVSTGNGLSARSNLVASRAFSSLESRGKLASSEVKATNPVDSRFSESFGDPMRKSDRRHHSQVYSGSGQMENGRVNTKDHAMDGQGRKEKNIHFSGPLVPSNKIEQVLKEHDRRIQEVARRLRNEKARGGRVQPHEMHSAPKFIYNRSNG